MIDRFLDKVYSARDAGETRDLYDAWSNSYEAELSEIGYVTPGRCAAALARFSADKRAPILDFGCGTGLSGLAFRAAGFEVIDGVDLSAEMLAKAREKDVYRLLTVVEAGKPLGHKPGTYAAICAVGVIGAGAAPISVFDTLMRGLARGGLLVLSFNDHSLADPVNEARVMEWTDCGAARLLFREYGDHLPGMGMKANVYVIEKN